MRPKTLLPGSEILPSCGPWSSSTSPSDRPPGLAARWSFRPPSLVHLEGGLPEVGLQIIRLFDMHIPFPFVSTHIYIYICIFPFFARKTPSCSHTTGPVGRGASRIASRAPSSIFHNSQTHVMVTIKRERMRNLNRSLRGWDASQSCHVCRAAGLGGNSGSAGFCHGATMPDAEDGAAGAHPAGCGGGAMSAGPSICCGPGCCWAAAGRAAAGRAAAGWAGAGCLGMALHFTFAFAFISRGLSGNHSCVHHATQQATRRKGMITNHT